MRLVRFACVLLDTSDKGNKEVRADEVRYFGPHFLYGIAYERNHEKMPFWVDATGDFVGEYLPQDACLAFARPLPKTAGADKA
ncbi:hypothetical protein [Atopobium sp. oral taxon 199]|uniref:hypothetical protein n=1 Tax=Atopobium sp. oral taxon 199 TaxID=712156 RepID=UPI0003A556AA|nr:hypothetical protein [Atopobium sp. oral taxon 199]